MSVAGGCGRHRALAVGAGQGRWPDGIAGGKRGRGRASPDPMNPADLEGSRASEEKQAYGNEAACGCERDGGASEQTAKGND